jgi:NADPH:quinone reductase-like Zn-dependent oxidoreductase
MISYKVVSDKGIEAIERVQVDRPEAGPGMIVVELKAASLNYRDLMVARGGYPLNDRRPVVPLSDGAGVVAEVGPGVTRWKKGDRVITNFMQRWIAGGPTLEALASSRGGGVDGVLAEAFAAPAESLVRVPDHLSFAEASTLPCAALTAWNALMAAGTTAGQTVLMLGTGGVSMFAVQLARALGAIPIITSASDAKLEIAKRHGAEHGVNYTRTPDWHREILTLTGGRGVDHVIETGGPGTLEQSLQSATIGGTVSLIGILAQGTPPALTLALLRCLTVRGIYVGSVEMFEAMNRAISAHAIRPIIDSTFTFDNALQAYKALENQRHVGKIVITRE